MHKKDMTPEETNRSEEERIIEILRSVLVKWDKNFLPIFFVPDWLLQEYDLTRKQVEEFLRTKKVI